MCAAGAAAGASIGAAAIGAGGDIMSGLLSNAVSYSSNKKLAKLQAALNYHYARKSALNAPSWNRQGLEDAGFNPMLAVQNSTSGANSSWTSASGVGNPDFGQLGSDIVSNSQSFQRLKNETDVADKTSKKLEAEGENLSADTANKLEENKYIGEKRKQEIANIQADTLEKEARMDNMKKQIELGLMGINVQQEANAIQAEKNEIERKGNPFRSVRDFGDKYNWSPRQFGEELGRRFARDHFPRFYKGQ